MSKLESVKKDGRKIKLRQEVFVEGWTKFVVQVLKMCEKYQISVQ